MTTTTTMAIKELLDKIMFRNCPKDYQLKNSQEFCNGNRTNCKRCWRESLKKREVELIKKKINS